MITHTRRADALSHVTARTRAYRAAVAVMLACALASGCSGTDVFQPGAAFVPHGTGVASPSSTSATASRTTAPSAPLTAPTVANPLDLSHVLAKPCDALTSSQLDLADHRLASATGATTNTAVAVGCGWVTSDFEVMVTLEFYTGGLFNGLRFLYEQRPSMAYWQPMVIENYPAVEADLIDERRNGECNVDVGTSDSRYFSASVTTQDAGQRAGVCDLATKVAGEVVDTLRGRR